MFFTIRAKNLDLMKYRIKSNARSTILLYKQGAAEIALDEYLIKHYKTNLKLMCLKLLNNASFNTNTGDEVVITFKTAELDKIASLITYGNSEVAGSDILNYAFLRK